MTPRRQPGRAIGAGSADDTLPQVIQQPKKPRAQDDPATDPQPQRAKEYRLQRRLNQAQTLARARIQKRQALAKCVADQRDTAHRS